MKNNNGFFALEAVAAFSVFLTIMLTIFPVVYQLKAEQQTLSERRYAQTQLQGQLLDFLYSEEPDLVKSGLFQELNEKEKPALYFQYNASNGLVKGCVTWQNAKFKKETFCLYGK